LSFSSTDFRIACGHFATGVAVLTAVSADGAPHGLTINSFVSLSLEPALVMAAIAHSSAQLPVFDTASSFAVNILTEQQQQLSALFARVTDNRFRETAWTPGKSGSPILAGALAVIECRVVRRFDEGDHRILIGEAVEAQVGEGKPLLYFRSGYGSIAG
jgi:flavin reductase (DIM6/NTAB) family NADH-FMN oxidoreductase RutF